MRWLEDRPGDPVAGAERVRKVGPGGGQKGDGVQVLLGLLRASTWTLGEMGSTWKVLSCGGIRLTCFKGTTLASGRRGIMEGQG